MRVWDWFTTKWSDVLGKALMSLTRLDGKDGLTWDDVKVAVEFIKTAETQFPTGAEKRAWVIEQIKNLRGIVLPHVIELLFWVALNYAKEKGFISLGDSKI